MREIENRDGQTNNFKVLCASDSNKTNIISRLLLLDGVNHVVVCPRSLQLSMREYFL